MKIVVSGYFGPPVFSALIVARYYKKIEMKEPVYFYRMKTEYSFERCTIDEYLEKGIYHHMDFVSFLDLGRDLDGLCPHDIPDFYLPGYKNNDAFREVIENLPEDFPHHFKIKEIPAGERYFFDHQGELRLESSIEWHVAT